MSLHVVGAGLGRTGTYSLKLALEHLLDGPCYHMLEVFNHPGHVPQWRAAANGRPPDWHAMLAGFRATVDWPAASFWPELSAAFPDALVLLSWRDSESWWRSASRTIFHPDNYVDRNPDWEAMWQDLIRARFTADLTDKAACIEAFERHNEAVRRGVAPERLLEWRPGDGWEPLCRALKLPLPEIPFPRANTTAEFLRARRRD
jgi:hypothetical protein